LSLKYQINTKDKVIITRAEGRVTVKEILTHFRTLAGDSDFQPDYAYLCDMRNIHEFGIRPSEMWKIAKVGKTTTGRKVALVASESMLDKLYRMYEIYRDVSPEEVHMFSSRDDALKWLIDE
jgi:hypothetical protein